MKRAVTYARVSGDDRSKDGRNLAGQLEMCREYALTNGYEIIAELAEDDRGASGASFELEQLNKVWELAHENRFDVLIVREIDRLSRNLAKQLIVEEELKRCDVRIEYVLGDYPNTPEGNLMKNIRATVAEYEREKIKERIVRGKQLKVKSGSVMTNGVNNSPYGYNVIEVDSKWALEIFEPEARIVRMIYNWYAFGDENGQRVSIRAIARKLTALRIPTRLDTGRQKGGWKRRKWGVWSDGQVGKILRGSVYRGTWQWGKRGTNGRGVGKKIIEVDVPAIVDDETWFAAQKRLERNRIESKRNRKYSYLLTSFIRCGHCGYTVHGNCVNTQQGVKRRFFYYRCQATRKGKIAGVKCDLPMFRLDDTDAVVWNWVVSLLSDPEAIQEGLQAYQMESKEQNFPLDERLKIVDDLIFENRKQLEKLLDLYLSGDFDKDVLLERQKRLEKNVSGLEHERAALVATINERTLSPDQIQDIYDFAAKISKGLQLAEDDFETRRKIIEDLSVNVTLAVEQGEKVIYASCVLGDELLRPVITDTYNDKLRRSIRLPPPRFRIAG